MRCYMRLFIALVILTLLPVARTQMVLRAQAAPIHTAVIGSASPDLPPLPGSCGGGLPGGDASAACCMFGYIVIDGQAVANAHVTIASTHGITEAWTSEITNNAPPYYRLSLSALGIQTAETITITAEYSNHTQTITHTVLGGGQQVDVVLPRNQSDDYVYDRQIWQQGEIKTFQTPMGVAVDDTGTVFVADTANARVQVFNSSGQFLRQWGTFGDGPGQFADPSGIAVDASGAVYVADTGNNRIEVFSRTGARLRGWGSVGNGIEHFYRPEGIAVDRDGKVYVADTGNNRIQVFDRAGSYIHSLGSAGSGSGQLNQPKGVAVDNSGTVYVADSSNTRIEVFQSNGTPVPNWGNGTPLNTPHGIAVTDSGLVYVTDTYNHRILVFSSAGTLLHQWGSSGTDDGQFSLPSGIAVTSSGQVYIADTNNNRIQMFQDGDSATYVNKWGDPNSGNEQFPEAWGIAVDSQGVTYVTDRATHQVQKFDATGNFVTKWGSLGNGSGQLNNPWGIAVTSDGQLVYVADSGNARIQVFDNNGHPRPEWGSFGSGPGQFNNPLGVAVDVTGNVYVADSGNNRIQKFDSNGQYLLSWDGSASAAGLLNGPDSVAVDSSGDVYVADLVNSRILMFHDDGSYVRTISSFGYNPGQVIYPYGVAADNNGRVYVADSSNNRVQVFHNNGTLITSWGNPGGGAGQFFLPEGIAAGSDGHVYVADTNNRRIQILRPMSYIPPVATIVQATPRTITPGQSVALYGRGGVSLANGTIDSYEWSLDGAPFAATADATLPPARTASLTSGPHTLSFRVHDTNSAFSASQSATLLVSGAAETWTFLLYLDGDNNTAPYLNDLTQLGALYRLEHGLSNANVTVAALYDGPGNGDSIRYLLRPDGTVTQEPHGEVDMGDPQTLIDFANWGKHQAPATYYYLAIADHANSLDGIAWDYTSTPPDYLTNGELRQSLSAITENGAHPIDVLHLDGCLMGLLENAYQIRGMAHYLISSENLAWATFGYDTYRSLIGPHTSPKEFAAAVADSYAARVGVQGLPYTIAALDIIEVNDVATATSRLAGSLVPYALASPANRVILRDIRNQAQKLDSNGDIALTNDDAYIDLEDWVTDLLNDNRVNDSAVESNAAALKSELNGLRASSSIHERHNSGSYDGIAVNLDGVHGIGIYYPQHASARTYQYLSGGLAFPADTLWDEFLASALDSLPLDTNPNVAAPNPIAPLPLHRAFLPSVRR